MLKLSHFSSPNHDARADGATIKLVILHYTGMQSGEAALQRLCDPAAKVSAHYVVEEDGRIFQLVDEQRRAWHAGKSYWQGMRDINSNSIGIEIVNPGHEFGYRPFPQAQMQAVRDVCADIQQRYGLPPEAFIGHSDIAPERKTDPGELFDWAYLAANGIGVLPVLKDKHVPLSEAQAREKLEKIGYESAADVPFAAVITAFQRHFVQTNITGVLDEPTVAALCGLAD